MTRVGVLQIPLLLTSLSLLAPRFARRCRRRLGATLAPGRISRPGLLTLSGAVRVRPWTQSAQEMQEGTRRPTMLAIATTMGPSLTASSAGMPSVSDVILIAGWLTVRVTGRFRVRSVRGASLKHGVATTTALIAAGTGRASGGAASGYWRYGGYCNGEHTHYGPWCYSSYLHSYGWTSMGSDFDGVISKNCYSPLS